MDIYSISTVVQDKVMTAQKLNKEEKQDLNNFIFSIDNCFVDVTFLSMLHGYDEVAPQILVDTIKEIWKFGGVYRKMKLSEVRDFNAPFAEHWSFCATGGHYDESDVYRYEVCIMRLWQIVTNFKVINNDSDDPEQWDVEIQINPNFNSTAKFKHPVEPKEKTKETIWIEDERKKFEAEEDIIKELYNKVDDERIKKLLKDRLNMMMKRRNFNKMQLSSFPALTTTKQQLITDLINYYKKTGEIFINSSHKAAKKVIQIDEKTMEIVATYDSARDAARQTDINVAKISLCCNNKLESYRGYIFKYDNEHNNNVKELINIKKQLKECTNKVLKLDAQANKYRSELDKIIAKKQKLSAKIIKSIIRKDKKKEEEYRKENEELKKDITYIEDKLNSILTSLNDN